MAPYGRHGYDGSPDGTLYIRGRSKTMILSGKRTEHLPRGDRGQGSTTCILVLESPRAGNRNGKSQGARRPRLNRRGGHGGVDKNDLPQIMQNNLTELNTLLAAYAGRSQAGGLSDQSSKKHPKRSIKRYQHVRAIDQINKSQQVTAYFGFSIQILHYSH